jgi:hypothetical protein
MLARLQVELCIIIAVNKYDTTSARYAVLKMYSATLQNLEIVYIKSIVQTN